MSVDIAVSDCMMRSLINYQQPYTEFQTRKVK